MSEENEILRSDVRFATADGTKLAGWIFEPAALYGGNAPCVVMSPGLGAVRRMGLERTARAFAEAGLAVLLYDHRGWADSEGQPRHEADPWRQIDDMRDAITFAAEQPGIDADRIGLWGTSYSGGHVLVVAAADPRVKVVTAQVPFLDARDFGWQDDDFRATLDTDRSARMRGEAPAMLSPAYEGSNTRVWVDEIDAWDVYPNEMTYRSMDMMRTYAPASYIPNIAPTPLMLILAENDGIPHGYPPCSPDMATPRVQESTAPVRVITLPCGHYDMYKKRWSEAVQPAKDFLAQTLIS